MADDWVAGAAAAGSALALAALLVVVLRYRRSTGLARGRLLWLAWGVVVTATAGLVGLSLRLLVDWPGGLAGGLAAGCVAVPAAVALGRFSRIALVAEPVVVHTLVIGGLVGLTGAVYILVVIGLGRVPEGDERTVLALSMAAAAVACVLAFSTRGRLEEWANQRIYGERHSPDEALRTFGGRMSRAVPLDELLLQLAETLKKTMQLAAAEVWTGTDGRLTLAVSVPDRAPGGLRLSDEELPVVARAHAQGNAWLQVWVPDVLGGRADRIVRCVSVAHLGELLGLLVVERPGDGAPFTADEDRVLVDLARQVGLALHNVRLDSALQASLEELKRRNEELVASRARVVAAADESRRQIERDLHDGAQQHLVALAVKVGLVKTLMDTAPETVAEVLDELRSDVQVTLAELRELAHGIYPPLLRDRGLPDALQTAANRAVLPTTVESGGIGRYDTEVEAAVYFCCLEAMQNAGKHAGDGATVCVAVGARDGTLWFEIRDDGTGFDPSADGDGHGFVNMRDRLGAFGGELEVRSAVGRGTTIRGSVPADALGTAEGDASRPEP
jgi:signal transduction histidine kinase